MTDSGDWSARIARKTTPEMSAFVDAQRDHFAVAVTVGLGGPRVRECASWRGTLSERDPVDVGVELPLSVSTDTRKPGPADMRFPDLWTSKVRMWSR